MDIKNISTCDLVEELNSEFTCKFQMSPRSLKIFVREMCGWKAKGPMRTRAVIKEQIRLWRRTA